MIRGFVIVRNKMQCSSEAILFFKNRPKRDCFTSFAIKFSSKKKPQ